MSKIALSPLDALAAELGAVAGQIERETALRIDAVISDVRRVDAERELRFTWLERRIETAIAGVKNGDPGVSVTLDDIAPLIDGAVQVAFKSLPIPKDGEPGKGADPAVVAALVDEAVAKAVASLPAPRAGKDADPELVAELVTSEVAKLPPPEPGKDADPTLIIQMVDEAVAKAIAALPRPENGKDADPQVVAELVATAVSSLPPPPAGKDADPEIIRQMVDEAVKALPPAKQGEPGPQGALPIVREYTDEVHYAGAVVTHEGATYQAARDTGRAPPHDDWRCIARAGRDGRSFRICGTYVEGVAHLALDVVALNGASFVAKRDDPGACPGDGWQLMASQGRQGKPGDRGQPGTKGDRGQPGPAIASIDIDGEGLLSVRNGDGTAVECDLYPVLAKLGS